MSLQTVQCPDTKQSLKKVGGKKPQNPRIKKLQSCSSTRYGFQTLAHVSIQKYEKSHREGRAETYSLPWFLKSKVQGACWSFWYDCTFSSCVYLSPADQTPWPLHFPRAQSRGDIPWPSGGSLSPHNYSANLFPSGHSEWPTHWKSNLSWVQTENIPSSAQKQSFLFHPKSFL